MSCVCLHLHKTTFVIEVLKWTGKISSPQVDKFIPKNALKISSPQVDEFCPTEALKISSPQRGRVRSNRRVYTCKRVHFENTLNLVKSSKGTGTPK